MSPTPPQLPHHVVPGTPARQTSLPLPGSARKSASSLHPLPAPSSQALRTFASPSRLERPFLQLETLELSSGSESEEETDRTQHQNPPSSSPDPVPIARPSVMGVTGAGQRIPSMAAYKSVPGQARRSAQVAAAVRSPVDGTVGYEEGTPDVWRITSSSPASTRLRTVPPEVLSDVAEDLRVVLEKEMRRVEGELRDQARRDLKTLYELDRMERPLLGTFAADTDLSLPSGPSSPGPAPPSSSKSFPQPLSGPPRSHYLQYTTRALNYEPDGLRSFPMLPGWENAIETTNFMKKAVAGLVNEDLTVDDIFVREVNSDPHRVRRDSTVLRFLVRRYEIDEARFKRLSNISGAKGAHLSQDLEAVDALRAFGIVVGRPASEVYRLYLLSTPDPDIFERPTGERVYSDSISYESCRRCGATLCKAHPEEEHFGDKPAQLRREQPSTEPCGSDCRLILQQRKLRSTWSTESTKTLEGMRKQYPEISSCVLAISIQKPCWEVPRIEIPRPPLQLTRSESPVLSKRRVLLPITDSLGYYPCFHTGPCAPCRRCESKLPTGCLKPTHCACVFAGTPCDRFCQCPDSCSHMFVPCKCQKDDLTACSGCTCRLAGRECEPSKCGCEANACVNSQIRRQVQKAAVVMQSSKPNAGLGLVLIENADVNDLIGLYGGESFSTTDTYGLINGALASAPETISYLFDLDVGHSINSKVYGNQQRYINHDNSPNCRVKPMYIEGTHQMAIYAICEIRSGQEVFIDYGGNYWNKVLPS